MEGKIHEIKNHDATQNCILWIPSSSKWQLLLIVLHGLAVLHQLQESKPQKLSNSVCGARCAYMMYKKVYGLKDYLDRQSS